MRVVCVLSALALLCALVAASDEVQRLPLRRRKRTATEAFQLPLHKRWAPAMPAPARRGGEYPLMQDLVGDLTALGEYYVELDVGGQLINVQVDTGSSTLAVWKSVV